MRPFRMRLESAIRIAEFNGYSVNVHEGTGFIRVHVVSPSGRSDNDYYFFAGNGDEIREREETLTDLVRWVS